MTDLRLRAADAPPHRRRAPLHRTVVLVLASAVLAVGLLAALLPGVFTSADPLQTDVSATLLPPSAEHPFGTDQSGRDLFARVVAGARLSLGIGFGASAVALVVGLLVGTAVATAPRWLDAVVMRVVDLLLAVPEFLVALVVVALLGPGITNVAIAITIAAVPVYIRLARGQARALLGAEHVEASRLLGVAPALVLVRHVVPHVFRRLTVLAAIGVGSAILAAAGLSFLGLGVAEPTPEWGLILSGGRNLLGKAWWIAVFPGLAITLTVVSVGGIGRILRSRADGTS